MEPTLGVKLDAWVCQKVDEEALGQPWIKQNKKGSKGNDR